MARTQQAQSNTPQNFLSLDDAATTLGVKRSQLSAYVQALDIPRHRKERRTYLAATDVERIAEWRTSDMQAKVNPAFQGMTIFADMIQPHTMPRNTKTYVEEGYAGNDTIFKAINYLAQNGAAIPPKLYTDRTMQTEIENHPLLDRLAQPNPEQDGVLYREFVLGWYFITGNSFQYAIRKGKSGPPDELWTLEAQKIHPIPNKTRGVTGYVFDDFPDNMNPIPAENIGHLRSWNPKDPIFGISPIEVGGLLVDQQTASRKWNLALLQNYAKPPGAWVYDGILDVNTRKKVKEALNLEMAGYRNAGKVPVLDGGFKWVGSATPPSELDWLKSLQYNAGQLANLYNMAPQLIGDTSATTYNNMEEAKAASYTEAIFPANDKMYSLWNMWLVPMYRDLCDTRGQAKAYLYYDKTTVEVVQNVIQARLTAASQRAIAAWSQGAASACTLNEAREMQGLPPDPQGDVYRIGAIFVRASELDKYAEQALQKPAAPPLPVPENMLDAPQPGEQQQQENDKQPNEQDQPEDEQKLSKPEKKPVDDENKARKNTVEWQSPDVDEQIEEYQAEGVTHLKWKVDGNPCELCLKNKNVVVELGKPFPSGHLLSPAHPNCECHMEPIIQSDQKAIDDISERRKKRQARDAYRDFMTEALV